MKSLRSPEHLRLMALLVAARDRAGLTQQQLADRLGKPQSFVAKYEGGERRLDLVEFMTIVRAIGFDWTIAVQELEVEYGPLTGQIKRVGPGAEDELAALPRPALTGDLSETSHRGPIEPQAESGHDHSRKRILDADAASDASSQQSADIPGSVKPDAAKK